VCVRVRPRARRSGERGQGENILLIAILVLLSKRVMHHASQLLNP
jgi:hypothetical protein